MDKEINHKENGNKEDDLDSIIKNHEQLYLRLEPSDEINVNELYLKINKDLIEKYDSQVSVYRLRIIDGLLLDYSRLNNEERKQLTEYLTQILQSENFELIVEGLHQVSY